MLKIVGHNGYEIMTLYSIWKNPFSDFFRGDGWLNTGYTQIEHMTQWKHEQTKDVTMRLMALLWIPGLLRPTAIQSELEQWTTLSPVLQTKEIWPGKMMEAYLAIVPWTQTLNRSVVQTI